MFPLVRKKEAAMFHDKIADMETYARIYPAFGTDHEALKYWVDFQPRQLNLEAPRTANYCGRNPHKLGIRCNMVGMLRFLSLEMHSQRTLHC